MWATLSKALVTALVPKLIEEIPRLVEEAFDDLMKDVNVVESIKDFFTTEDDIEVVKEITAPKVPDTTQLTQWDYDLIMRYYTRWYDYNKGLKRVDRKLMGDLIIEINDRLELHKSKSSIAIVWQNQLNRNSLPVGSDPREFVRQER